MQLYEDQLSMENPGSAGDSMLFAPPSPGIGLAGPASPAAPAAPAGRPFDERLAYAAEAFGAGFKGQPSLLEREQKQAREDKFLKLKELSAHVDAVESGAKIAKTLQGDARSNFVKDYSSQLEGLRPGLGKTFAHISDNPDTLDLIQQYMPYLPEAAKMLMKKSPDAFWKYAGSEGGQKDIENAKNQYYMRLSAQKVDVVMSKLDQLGIPDDLVKELTESKTASAFKKVQDALPDGHKAKLTDKEWTAINSTAHNQELFYNSLGLQSPKDEAEIRKKKAEQKAPTMRTIMRDTQEVQQEWNGKQWVDVGSGPRFKPGGDGDRRPQVIQGDAGPMVLSSDGTTAKPVLGPDGQPIKGKGSERPVPTAVITAIATNVGNIRRAQTALDLLEGKDVVLPGPDGKSVTLKGDKNATGWKGYNFDSLLQRFDQEGVDARAYVGDIGSMIVHDRSGAAVTASETPRLRPFIPMISDDPPVAVKKLKRLIAEATAINNEFKSVYSEDQGYKQPSRRSTDKPIVDDAPAPPPGFVVNKKKK